MNKLKNSNQNTENNFVCDFCNRKFAREKTWINHVCEPKRRWDDKDKRSNVIAFNCWLNFYKKHTASNTEKKYKDFIKSSYYSAFVKFGAYCVTVKVWNPERYFEWLLNEQIKIDQWHLDVNYTKFIIDYSKLEDPLDAIARSIETTIELAELDKIQTKDVLRYGNKNRICYAITTGKISPWLLYQSESGKQFLESLDETQIKMIFDYIKPEQWAIKFSRTADLVDQVKNYLLQGGY